MARPKKAIDFQEEINQLDIKISKHQKQLTGLKNQRKYLVECQQAATLNTLVDAIKDSGKSPDEILTMLQNDNC